MDTSPEALVAAFRTVTMGDMLVSPGPTRRLVEQYVRAPRAGSFDSGPITRLTDRKCQLLSPIAHGLTNAKIWKQPQVPEGAVKTHVSRILFKLGLRDRVQAVIAAFEFWLVAPSP